MTYTPDLDWVDDAPPGFTAARMNKMQLGIADASQAAAAAQSDATTALQAAQAAQGAADEALEAVAGGVVTSVDDDVLRVYLSTTTPPGGVQAGDLQVSFAHTPAGPDAIPNLFGWYDAAHTGARDLGTAIPDVSGNGNHIAWRDLANQFPASVGYLNGLPAFHFDTSRYSRPGTRTGVRTLSGVCRFDGLTTNDQSLFYTGGNTVLDLGVRASTGDLFCMVGATTVYEGPLSWSAGGQAFVSFILALDEDVATLWLGGQQVASESITWDGSYATLALSRGANAFFTGVLAEFAEHEGTAVDSTQAAELAAYYREKWRV